MEPIKRNNIKTFSKALKQTTTKKYSQTIQLKNDRELYSRLFVACQTREGNLDVFFAHENQSFPPSLAKNGLIRNATKSDLLKSLLPIQRYSNQSNRPNVDVIFLDGPAVIHMLQSKNVFNFEPYKTNILPLTIDHCLEEMTSNNRGSGCVLNFNSKT